MRHPAIRPLHAVPALLAILLAAVPASAVILKLTPLKDVLEGEQFIFTATMLASLFRVPETCLSYAFLPLLADLA